MEKCLVQNSPSRNSLPSLNQLAQFSFSLSTPDLVFVEFCLFILISNTREHELQESKDFVQGFFATVIPALAMYGLNK